MIIKRISGAAAIALAVLISCRADAIAGCQCMTGDQGRWRDQMSLPVELKICVSDNKAFIKEKQER
jgi:hypothetical protein